MSVGLFALTFFVAAIWALARYLFRDVPIDENGASFFTAAFNDVGLMESRLAADPRPPTSPSMLSGIQKSEPKAAGLYELVSRLVELKLSDDDAESSRRLKAQLNESEAMLKYLSESCCVIPADASKIRILCSPLQFFEELKQRIRRAQRRIVITALYVGDGPMSKDFMATLEEKVAEQAAKVRHQRLDAARDDDDAPHSTLASPSDSTESLDPMFLEERFCVDVVLDYNRMHDRKNMITIRRLAELASQYKHEVDVRLHLFQTPSSLSRFIRGRSKELLGVQHTKIFAFDDEDVILTGANLSDDYFKNRMDRYMIVESNPQLAAWCAKAVSALASLSHRVVSTSEDALPSDVLATAEIFTPNVSPLKRSPVKKGSSADLLEQLASKSGKRKATTHQQSKLVILPNSCFADPTHDHRLFRDAARHQFVQFAADVYEASADHLRYLSSRAAVAERREVSAFLFPTLQFGRVGIHHDVCVVERVLRLVNEKHRAVLTSPYLNMYWRFTQALLDSKAAIDFITCSLTTNGWFGQRGFAGQIPYYYLQLERSYYFLLESYRCIGRVRVREFTEPGTTFHAKGMWVSPHDPAEDRSIVRAPFLAAYGSTNYGNRSTHKDVEVEAFLFTWNAALQEQMRTELQRLLQKSEEVSRERFVGPKEGRFQPVVSLVASLGQDYM